jgi:hypothetical protein
MDRTRRWFPAAAIVAIAAAMLAHGPIPQLAHYHEFADTRAMFGIANAGDVLSNAGFAIVGAWGLAALWPHRREAALARSWPGYALFFAALVLTAFGSAYYHLAPDNARLLWDRLPIALACAGLIAAVDADTHTGVPRRWLMPALALVGVASVLWWSITDARGAGDLRPYLLLQAAPLVLIPLWQANHRAPRSERLAFAAAIALYVAAKAAELGDRAIYDAAGGMSGHTMKHLLSTAASAVIVASVVARVRRPLPMERESFTPSDTFPAREYPGRRP